MGSRLRGWGGVGAMAVACAASAALLLPLGGSDGGGSDGAPRGGPGAGSALPAVADDCATPEASLRPGGAEGAAIKRIKDRGKLVAGVDQNSYRWGYRNPQNGELEGFDIDLVRAIAKDVLGDENAVIFRAIPTNQRIQALQSGKVDIVARTMSISCKRLKDVSFSTAYFQTGQQLLVPRAVPKKELSGYDRTLKGKRVCSAEGSTAYDKLASKSYGAVFQDEHDGTDLDPDLITVPNQLDCLVRLQLGEVDAVVTDSALAASQAAQDPAVELRGAPFTTEYYGVATKLGSDDLVRRINRVLDDYRKSAWMKSYEKWLEKGLPGITAPPAPKYRD
ncbi:glutamate ABC transporter substrate-binding protein [Streptomyces sp. NPDC050504]|uniref:glutamate ABC transporter substrate-binding protein n=1 Tax=Streptomyces sp. NPDC050504 TaxID=3365618 RepID=UPI0037A10230